MRKLFYLLCVLAGVLAFYGCGEKAPTNVPVSRPTQELPPHAAMPLYALQGADGFSTGSGNGEGYFSISPVIRQNGSGNLRYTDYATRQTVTLCGQPNCTHSDESCTGWLAPGSGGVVPSVVGETLALVYLGTGDYDTWGAAALPHIETMNFDGSERRKIAEFKANERIEKPFFTDGQSLYFRLTTDQEKGRTASIRQIDLATGENSQLCALDADRVDWIWGAFDRSVLLYRTKEENGADPFEQVSGYQLYLLNIDTLEETPVFAWEAQEPMPNLFGSSLVVCNEKAGEVEVRDLRSGETFSFSQVRLPEDPNTDFVVYDYRDGHLLYRVRKLKEHKPGIESLVFYTADKEGGEPRVWDLQYMFEGKAAAVTVIDTLATGQYLVVKHEAYEQGAAQNEEGVPYYSNTPVRDYALIDAADYWEGIPRYIDITDHTT
ncbi:hypothetical protein [Allofournierella sp.]|uniref:hypothetical protein n=1 Tax=Allofournierella sp. TaxID=1940256 RepID=UPI003AB2D826